MAERANLNTNEIAQEKENTYKAPNFDLKVQQDWNTDYIENYSLQKLDKALQRFRLRLVDEILSC